jgi:PAS domain S-box-containing protein
MMQDYQQELAAIKELLKRDPKGMSVTDISKALSKNKNTVGRYLDILLISGQVDMRTYGMAKVYTLSQRVPLSAMLSYSKELIMVLDAEHRIIEVNENFLALLNLSREDTIGRNIAFISPREVDAHELLDNLSGAYEQKEYSVTFHLKGGGVRIFQKKCVPTVFEDGGAGLTIILEDITDHVLAEQEIRESEERFRMMAENIRDGLIILENGTFIFGNRRVAEISGYSFDELKLMSPLDLIAEECREELEGKMRFSGAHMKGAEDLLVWIIRKDGKRRYIYNRISFVQHQEKVLTFIILTDITDLKIKEDALLESEQRFRMMADNIHDGLIILEDNKIVYTNRRIFEITGFDREEMAHVNLLDIVASEEVFQEKTAGGFTTSDHKKIREILTTIKPGSEKPGEAIFWITRKDGTKRCIHVNVTAPHHQGVVSLYITVVDITSFAEKEKALRDRIASLQEFLS